MAIDNTEREIYVLLNSNDPTSALVSGLENTSKVSNIPLIVGDKLPIIFYLSEENQSNGSIIHRKLESGETLHPLVKSSDDSIVFGAFGSFSNKEIQPQQGAVFAIYLGTDRKNLSGEYIGVTLKRSETSHLETREDKVVFWFRTSGTSLPPNLLGYESVAVDVADGENPYAKLATAMQSHSLITSGTHIVNPSQYVEVEPAQSGQVSERPIVSNTSKIRITFEGQGQDQIIGYRSVLTFNQSAITTAVGANDSILAKMVLQIKQNTGTLEKTIATQDVTLYKDYSS